MTAAAQNMVFGLLYPSLCVIMSDQFGRVVKHNEQALYGEYPTQRLSDFENKKLNLLLASAR